MMMINDEEDDQQYPADAEVTAATMRRLAFEEMDDDYYLGAAVGEEAVDSDDDVSSDDEVKTHLRKLAGIEKEVTKDAFGRRRRRSEFEDEMDSELDQSIAEHASSLLEEGKVVEIKEDDALKQILPDKKMKRDEESLFDEQCRDADEKWRQETDDIERKMAALELLPYDVDLTDSEVDPEMPAAVLKNKDGEPVKLVYSCKNGLKFDVEERKQRQKERRMRIAAARLPEKQRRQNMIKTVVEAYTTNDVASSSRQVTKPYEEDAKASQPLSSILSQSLLRRNVPTEPKSILKKSPEKKAKMVVVEKMEVDEKEGEQETNPIKRAAMDRLKEIEKNDELFYDDQEDDDNERWVKDHRKKTGGTEDAEADGVLSCPGCMIELTRDCQRHEIYKTQYRAMFVSNCQLDEKKMAIEKTGKEKRRERQKAKKGGKADGGPVLLGDSDLYTPVKCSSCATLVAMMDSDEVYHFFNVLAGYS